MNGFFHFLRGAPQPLPKPCPRDPLSSLQSLYS
jgi:hypothetical protein